MTPTNNHSESGRTASDACTSPAEVRAYLQKMKCKDPEQVLGSGGNRGLAVALGQATVVGVLALLGFTVVPYALSKQAPAKTGAVKPAEKVESAAKVETPDPAKTAPTPPTPTAVAPTKDKTKPPAGKDFLDKIGATDTKTANPKVNPLDKTTDDLFKDIDKK